MSSTLERLTEIFREVFEDDDLSITPETSASEVYDWDSLMHISLVVSVERAFGKRRELQASTQTLDGYLDSLEMRGSTQTIDDTSMQRVVQLLGKTNQWNLSTRRLSEANVRAVVRASGSIGLALRLSDRFGDYGLISLILAERSGDVLRITDWLMSCRVIGRTAEHFLFGELLARAPCRGRCDRRGVSTYAKEHHGRRSLSPTRLRDP